MKLFRIFGRSIRDAFKSTCRNFSLSFASVVCIAITLIVVAFSLIASYNVENFTTTIEKDVTIVAFLNTKVSPNDINKIEKAIKNNENVESYIFKSKETVKKEMMKESKTFEDIMNTWDEEDNPLQDTFMIKVKEINRINETANQIKAISNVEIVNYGEKMVEQMLSTFHLVEKISLIAMAALIIVTIFLIINTIKLTIFSRKREISIMRLVGASNFSIKNPFVIEGMFLGLIGSIIPVVTVIYGYYALYNQLGGQLFSSIIKLVKPYPFVFIVSLIVTIIGVVVGMLGSYQAVRRYLKI